MDAFINTLQSLLGEDSSASVLFVALSAGAVFALSMGLLALVVGAFDPIRRRLGRLHQDGDWHPSSADSIAESLRPLASIFMPKRGPARQRVARLLIHAGYRSPEAINLYYGVKSLLIMMLPCVVLFASPFFPRITTGRLILYAVVAGYLGSLVCSIWLDKAVEKRQRALRVAFPDTLDLLVVCVESGLGLAPALQRVSDELGVAHPELGEELALVNAEMRAGVERGQALKNLSDRTGLADIRGLTALLVQTMRFGTSVAEALRVYSEEFRDKRTQAAEEKAAKIGTKMIFPLVLCLFPSFFLVAVGPAVIGLIDVFTKMGK